MTEQNMHVEDLHGYCSHEGTVTEGNTTGFGLMDMPGKVDNDDKGIWLDKQDDDLFAYTGDGSMFYDDFPILPDFSCISSSSSNSSSTTDKGKTVACSSSPASSTSSFAASLAVRQPDNERGMDKNNDQQIYQCNLDATEAGLSSTASMEIPPLPVDQYLNDVNCMDMMEDFGCMDLLENNDFFDSSLIFDSDDPIQGFDQALKAEEPQQQNELPLQQAQENNNNNNGEAQQERETAANEMAEVFLGWLKENKDIISAEDLRNVKIKKSTVELAARRLGGGKEAMKKLLKLILEWVQKNYLSRRKLREATTSEFPNQQHQKPNFDHNCTPQPSFLNGQPSVGYTADGPYGIGGFSINGQPYVQQAPAEYPVLNSAQTWGPAQFSNYNTFPDKIVHPLPLTVGTPVAVPVPLSPAPLSASQALTGYGVQYPCVQYVPGCQVDNGAVRLGYSATKEARKKRMARHRRVLPLRHHDNQHTEQQNQPGNSQAAGLGNNSTAVPRPNQGNWVYWPVTIPSAPGAMLTANASLQAQPSVDQSATQVQNHQWQATVDRRQGSRSENNLKKVLQKVLKQSDVGNLGRIVLPKKEAESHLPDLDAKDGINIVMEDLGTSRVFNMRYRFWPNNKSRMYLLENTGDFVRANGLQEGDFIAIYYDVKSCKYLIRGMKMPNGAKIEPRRSTKSQKNQKLSSPASKNLEPAAALAQTVN